MVLALASVTDALVTFATQVIGDLGLVGIVLMIAVSGIIGVPGTELPMLFAGFNVYQHNLTIAGVIIAGVIGDTIGGSLAYAVGRYGRGGLLERHGGRFHVDPARLAVADRWFRRRGDLAIPLSRWLPFARMAFTFAAGVTRVPFPRFAALATIGSIPWIAAFALVGRELGRNWQSWKASLDYVDYAILALIVLAVVFVVVRRARAAQDMRRRRVARDEPARDVVS